jgi:hypothetical protein
MPEKYFKSIGFYALGKNAKLNMLKFVDFHQNRRLNFQYVYEHCAEFEYITSWLIF